MTNDDPPPPDALPGPIQYKPPSGTEDRPLDRIRREANLHRNAQDGGQLDELYAAALGKAVIAAWGMLPHEVQHMLFEHAVAAGDREQDRDSGSIRTPLAEFLHHHHPRTD
jgi:hypothetical protein